MALNLFGNSDDESKKDCALCDVTDKLLAGLGLAIGVVFVYISIDILTGGRLTSALSRTPRMVEVVIPDGD